MWLIGHKNWKIHVTRPDGATEVALASRFSLCTFPEARTFEVISTKRASAVQPMNARLSEQYRRYITGMEPSVVPLPNAHIILSVFVPIPEGGVVLLFLSQIRGRPRRPSHCHVQDGLALTLAVATGALSLIGIRLIYQQEYASHT